MTSLTQNSLDADDLVEDLCGIFVSLASMAVQSHDTGARKPCGALFLNPAGVPTIHTRFSDVRHEALLHHSPRTCCNPRCNDSRNDSRVARAHAGAHYV